MPNIKNSFNHISDSEIIINLPKHIVPKALTTQIGLANDIDFVGRKEELQKVDELLNQNSMLLLLNGIGGIGKSTLASYYLNQKKDEFDYYGFVQVNEDIKRSFVSAFNTSLNLQSENIDDLFNEIMNKLQNLEGQKLLIIDDVKEMDNQLDEVNTLMTLKHSGFQILFTSREVKDNIKNYPLPMMNDGDARDLFLKHYDTDDINNINIIVKEYLDYHPLFIEMTAKTLTQRRDTLSLFEVIDKFNNGKFTAIKRNKNESFNKFLKNFSYDNTILKKEKTLLFLKRLSVLPSIEISFKDLYEFLVCKDKEILQDIIIELVNNGWLIKSDGGYKFHQILKEFVWDNYLPKFEEIEKQIDYCIDLTKDSSDAQKALDNRDNLFYFKSVLVFIEKLKIKNRKIATIYNNFGLTYDHLNEPDEKIIRLYEKSLEIRGKIENKDKAETLNNLAGKYTENKEYTKAKVFHFRALKIRKKYKGEYEYEIGSSYNNLGVLFYRKDEYHKSQLFFCKYIQILESLIDKENESSTKLPNLKSLLAKGYDSLGVLYRKIGEINLVEIIKLHNKALNIRIKYLGEYHIDNTSSYEKLSDLYLEKNNLEIAHEYIKKAIEIYEKNFPNDYPKLVDAREGLNEIEDKLKESNIIKKEV